jgi:Glycosyl hydrolase family 26
MGKRSLFIVLMSTLTAIGAFVYLSPSAPTASMREAARMATVNAKNAALSRGLPTALTPPSLAQRRKARANARPGGRDKLDGPTKPAEVIVVDHTRTVVHTVTKTAPPANPTLATPAAVTAIPLAHDPVCSDFAFQQDAQAAYVKNLADPYGLDGVVGPADDDGLACSLLPVDPARPASAPAGAKPPPPAAPEGPPVTPTMESLLAPKVNYFGVSTPQAPFDWKEFEVFVNAAQKRPNLLMLFSGWDRDYPTDKITTTWRRGMLPVITWEPRSTVQANPDQDASEADDGYTLESIIDGEHDEYLTRYAQAVATLGLPVGIRFAHEMNGPWYPWSEQANGNHRGEYVQAWRHVHDIFTAAGATNAIWIWSPSRVNPYPSVALAPLYPGDQYVDWLGMTGYFRLVDQTPSFARTFTSTLDALSQIADKPVLLSEVGATESGGNKAKKIAWIKDLFAGMAANPQIIGFAWFDQSIAGNDWRIESSSAATKAFADGVADPRYGSGVWYPR